MRKSTSVLTIVVLVAAAYTGASWYTGMQAQQAIENMVAKVNDGVVSATTPAPGNARLTLVEYRRGVFSSDVVYSLQRQGASDRKQEYLLSDHLQHGPFPLGALKQGQWMPLVALSHAQLLPSASTQGWYDKASDPAPITGQSKLSFSGRITSDWAFRPLNIMRDEEVLKFSGGSVHAVADRNLTSSTVNAQFKSLEYSVRATAEHLVMNDIVLDYEGSGTDTESHQASTVRVAHLKLDSSDGHALLVRDSVVVMSNHNKGDLQDASAQCDLGSVSVSGVDLGSITMGIKGHDVGIKALKSLADSHDALSQNDQLSEGGLLSDMGNKVLQKKVADLLASNPTVSIEPLVWKNAAGESRGSLAVQMMPPPPGVVLGADETILKVIRMFKLDLQVEKPMFVQAASALTAISGGSEIAEQAGQLYDEYALRLKATDLASAENDRITMQWRYQDGLVQSNGKTMLLPELFQRAAMAFFM